MTDALDRPLPHDDDAERATLGCIVLEPQRLGEVETVLRDGAAEFDRPAHQYAYDTLRDVILEGSGIDAVTLRRRMEHDARWKDMGGYEFLAGLVNAVPSALRVRHYAEIVHKQYVCRQAIGLLHRYRDRLYDELEPEKVVTEAVAHLARIAESASPKRAETFLQQLEEAFAETETVKDGMAGPSTVGWRRAELVVIGGRTSDGKTALLVQMAHSLVFRQGVPTLFVTLEMSARQLALRFAAFDCGVPMRDIQRNQLTDEQRVLVREARHRAKNVPLYVDDRSNLTATQIHGRAIMEVARHKVRVVIVDYAQIMRAEDRREKRHEEIGQMTAGLKALAKGLNLSVIVAAQLRRPEDERRPRRPRLSALRESGALEQEPDAVLLLYRPIIETQDEHGQIVEEPSVETELILAKQRNGPTGVVKLIFNKPRMRFDLEMIGPFQPPPPSAPATPGPLFGQKEPF